MEHVYVGGCHCGAVRFRVRLEEKKALACNCSVCTKKGFLHLIVPPERFELLDGESALCTYEFNTRVAKHRFCKFCGIHPYYRPRSHPDQLSVNLRCLDGVELDTFTLVPFDGQNWETNVDSIR